MAELLKQSSTAYPLCFLLVQSADHITGLTGASPTVTLSKAGGAFASPSGAVTEIANGWYKVAGNATDTATLGPLLLHATAASGDPCDDKFEVVAFDPQDGVHLGISALPNTAVTTNASLLTSGTGTDQVSVASGKVLLQATQAGVTIPTVTAVGTLTTYTGNTPQTGDAFARLGAPAGASVSADIAAVKSETDTILADVNTGGGAIYARLGAPTGASMSADIASVKSSVGSVTGAVGSVTAAVAISLTETLNAARALDSIADTSLTVNDAFHCAIAGAAGQKDASSGTNLVVSTPHTATVLRTYTITTTTIPTTVPDKIA